LIVYKVTQIDKKCDSELVSEALKTENIKINGDLEINEDEYCYDKKHL